MIWFARGILLGPGDELAVVAGREGTTEAIVKRRLVAIAALGGKWLLGEKTAALLFGDHEHVL